MVERVHLCQVTKRDPIWQMIRDVTKLDNIRIRRMQILNLLFVE